MRLYGGKGQSAPAPDPRLIEAQIRSMGIQDDMIGRIVASAEAMQPLQEEQMRFGLDANRTAFEQSQADRNYALEQILSHVVAELATRLTMLYVWSWEVKAHCATLENSAQVVAYLTDQGVTGA